MTTEQKTIVARPGRQRRFETRDFYLACFLRCSGYPLLGLRAEGRRKVLPFRTALLSAVHLDDEFPVAVQPVSLAYGPALSPDERDGYAWYGDMELVPHLWRLFGFHNRSAVHVRFHPARLSSEFADRRALAAWAEATVSSGLKDALSARAPQKSEADDLSSVTVSP